MAVFEIHYGFDIKNKKNDYELSYWERGTFDIEEPSKAAIDTAELRKEILNMAHQACKKGDYVIYANYHKISKKKGSVLNERTVLKS
ncbi:MAG: hypothetical protein KIG84_08205 [Bacteroidales bacterium]|nr:hypothetical protein [Bacteroidales bacterium]